MTHQKRLSAPRTWAIPRKTHRWSLAPRPGPHNRERAMPVGLFLRDVLGVAENRREVKRILQRRQIRVNGAPVRDDRFPVGVFDVLSMEALSKSYVVVPDGRGRLRLREVAAEQARTKISRVAGKTVVKGGKFQIHLFEGTNLTGDRGMKTGDGVVLSLPDRKVVRHYPRVPGARAFVAGGTQSGALGTIQEVRSMRGSAPNVIRLSTPERGKGVLETIEDYVFVIGPEEEAFLKGAGDGS